MGGMFFSNPPEKSKLVLSKVLSNIEGRSRMNHKLGGSFHDYLVYIFLLSAIIALHLSRILYKSTPFYAKQTQFAKYSNERKYCFNKVL